MRSHTTTTDPVRVMRVSIVICASCQSSGPSVGAVKPSDRKALRHSICRCLLVTPNTKNGRIVPRSRRIGQFAFAGGHTTRAADFGATPHCTRKNVL